MRSGDRRAKTPEWSARRCIDWIERRNLFLIALDSRKEWYRYHQMFRSVLLQRGAAELGPDRLTEVQRSAAAWFAQHGLVDEAVRHALAAGDRELAAGFLAQGLAGAQPRGPATLERWLGLFPDEFIQDRPDLLIVRGFSLYFSWQLGALARVVHARPRCSTGESPRLPGLSQGRCAAAWLCWPRRGVLRQRPGPCGAHSRQALALLPEAWSFVRVGPALPGACHAGRRPGRGGRPAADRGL